MLPDNVINLKGLILLKKYPNRLIMSRVFSVFGQFYIKFPIILVVMSDKAAVFWKNVKKEIKLQNTTQEWIAKKASISFNTFQGWISKAIYPRANEAVRIAVALDTSVEYLVRGAAKDNSGSVDSICKQLTEIHRCLDEIQEAVKKIN